VRAGSLAITGLRVDARTRFCARVFEMCSPRRDVAHWSRRAASPLPGAAGLAEPLVAQSGPVGLQDCDRQVLLLALRRIHNAAPTFQSAEHSARWPHGAAASTRSRRLVKMPPAF
jgi:hypothetical protein